jgi:hypothetical protein
MKLCKDCHFLAATAGEMQRGRKTFAQMVPICIHEECRDVITGEPIMAMGARQAEVYCGFKARYWKKKEEAPKQESGNVIQLDI